MDELNFDVWDNEDQKKVLINLAKAIKDKKEQESDAFGFDEVPAVKKDSANFRTMRQIWERNGMTSKGTKSSLVELLEKDVKLFNSDSEDLKVFENYIKFQDKLEATVNTMNVLRKQLLPEEEIVANKRVKNSSQGFVNKAKINGNSN